MHADAAGVEAEIFAFGDEQWERAAQLRVPGRSGVECRAQWANRLRPGINLGPWTKEEDARLLQLAEQHKRADVRRPTPAVPSAMPARASRDLCTAAHSGRGCGLFRTPCHARLA